MTEAEQEILGLLLRDMEEAAALFSNEGAELRERTVVAGLLRVLQVEFRDEEIIKQGPEPVDIWFRDTRFQVTEILDDGRPRDLEIKQRLDRVRKAKGLDDVVEQGIISSLPLSLDELTSLVANRCSVKANKYHRQGKEHGNVDLLIYVNQQQRHLVPSGTLPATARAPFDGWRSVSVIMERFAVVFRAADNAPSFLVDHRAQVIPWKGFESVFPKLSAR